MPFLSEPEPPRGRAMVIVPGVSRLVAPNPGQMTYHGTNTYLVEGPDGIAVIDPGPDSAEHRGAIVAAAGGRVAAIVLSHRHADHAAGAAALRRETGAPVLAFRADAGLLPDIVLRDGDAVAGMTALHMPGHAPDHLCFARPGGMLFSGDHVMSWAATVLMPPDGDLAAYLGSLRRLLDRAETLYLPGHGPPILQPRGFVEDLLRQRQQREAMVVQGLSQGPATLPALVGSLFARLDASLRPMVEQVILLHLVKLRQEGRAACDGGIWRAL